MIGSFNKQAPFMFQKKTYINITQLYNSHLKLKYIKYIFCRFFCSVTFSCFFQSYQGVEVVWGNMIFFYIFLYSEYMKGR